MYGTPWFLFVTLTSLGLGANNMRMTALKMSFPRQGDFAAFLMEYQAVFSLSDA